MILNPGKKLSTNINYVQKRVHANSYVTYVSQIRAWKDLVILPRVLPDKFAILRADNMNAGLKVLEIITNALT